MKSMCPNHALALLALIFLIATNVKADGIEIKTPQNAILSLKDRRQFAGVLKYLNAKVVSFRVPPLAQFQSFASSTILAVQTANDVYFFNSEKKFFESAKDLGFELATITLVNGSQFVGIVPPPDNAQFLEVRLANPIIATGKYQSKNIQSLVIKKGKYVFDAATATLILEGSKEVFPPQPPTTPVKGKVLNQPTTEVPPQIGKDDSGANEGKVPKQPTDSSPQIAKDEPLGEAQQKEKPPISEAQAGRPAVLLLRNGQQLKGKVYLPIQDQQVWITPTGKQYPVRYDKTDIKMIVLGDYMGSADFRAMVDCFFLDTDKKDFVRFSDRGLVIAKLQLAAGRTFQAVMSAPSDAAEIKVYVAYHEKNKSLQYYENPKIIPARDVGHVLVEQPIQWVKNEYVYSSEKGVLERVPGLGGSFSTLWGFLWKGALWVGAIVLILFIIMGFYVSRCEKCKRFLAMEDLAEIVLNKETTIRTENKAVGTVQKQKHCTWCSGGRTWDLVTNRYNPCSICNGTGIVFYEDPVYGPVATPVELLLVESRSRCKHCGYERVSRETKERRL